MCLPIDVDKKNPKPPFRSRLPDFIHLYIYVGGQSKLENECRRNCCSVTIFRDRCVCAPTVSENKPDQSITSGEVFIRHNPFTCRRQSDTASAMTDKNKHSTARKERTKQKHRPEREDMGVSAEAFGRYADEGHCLVASGRRSVPELKRTRIFSFRAMLSCG